MKPGMTICGGSKRIEKSSVVSMTSSKLVNVTHSVALENQNHFVLTAKGTGLAG
jgi:hypothetical protein